MHALLSLQPPDMPVDRRIEGGGIPASAPEAEVRIRDVDSGQLAPAGAAGEIEIRAPTNFSGYMNNPEATAEAVGPDGFFRTGDIGYLRGDGSFVFLTRRGDAMRLGGFLVNPAEIESALARLPGVAEAQVVAVEIDGRNRCVAPGAPLRPETIGGLPMVVDPSFAMLAGMERDAFTTLTDGPLTAGDVASVLGVDPAR